MAQTFWRRQLQLSCLAAVTLVVNLAVSRLVLGSWGSNPDNRTFVLAAVTVSALLLAAVLLALVVHAYRVATFAFRRGDS